jgi:glycosyltransferase involved in cell wall biosynthesis
MGKARLSGRAIWSRNAIRNGGNSLHESYDVTHAHNLFPMLSPSVLRLGDRTPMVMTLHNYRLMCIAGTFLREGRICEDCLGRTPWPGVVHSCYKESRLGSSVLAASLTIHRLIGSFNGPALYLAVSEFLRDKHLEAGWPADRLWVRPNFVWPRQKRNGPGTFFLYAGRLAEDKDLATLRSLGENSGANILVAGEGPLEASLGRDPPPGMTFLGKLAPKRIAGLLKESRALLVPTLSYEGSPRSLIESYAAGVPVIASNVGSIPEFVTHGETGILAEPKDAGAWGDAVEQLRDDSESERMGNNAHSEWLSKYTPEAALRSLESAYGEARRIFAERKD